MSELDDASLKRVSDPGTSGLDEQPPKRLKAEQSSPEATNEQSGAQATTSTDDTVPTKTARERKAEGGVRKKKDRRAKIVKARGGRTSTAPEGSVDPDAPKTPRLPKRPCALLIGFSGTGFSGMQLQPLHLKTRTIENVLFDALVEAGAVSKDNSDDPNKISLSRSARTDAGVHAAGNLVSLKMITAVPGVPDIVERINECLPPQIRVWSYLRVQNGFDARTSCDSRKYTYFFPSHLLLPPKPGSGLHQALNKQAQNLDLPLDSLDDAFWLDNPASAESTPEEDLRLKKRWRVDSARLAVVREIAAHFEGTHNYHNFTVGRDFKEAAASRFMKRISISDPEVHGGTEWIPVVFHGQSFILHQRKMMCALVLTCRCRCPPSILEELFGPRKVFVPKMPALGLLLEYPIFETYNDRIAKVNEGLDPSDDKYRPPIDFENHRLQIDAFKQEYIYENMRAIEERDGIFDSWIRTVDSYSGTDILWLNTKGIIPPEAVISKGSEKRPNPFKERKRFDTTNFSKPVGEVEGEYDEAALSKKDVNDLEEE